MNYLLPAIAIAIVLFFASKKLFATFAFVAVQALGNFIIDRTNLNAIPVLNWDYELTNILLIIATVTVGPFFAVLFAGVTMAWHAFHEEVVDLHSTVDYALRAMVIVGVLSFSGQGLASAIPWAILFSKIPVIILNKFLWGSYIWSVFNYKEIFSVIAYFAVFNLL